MLSQPHSSLVLSLSLAGPSRLLILLPVALLVGFKVALSAEALATRRAGVTASLVCAGHVGLELLAAVEALLTFLAWMSLALCVLLLLVRPELSCRGENKVALWARDLASCRRSHFCCLAIRFVVVGFGILRGGFRWPPSPPARFGFRFGCRQRCWRRLLRLLCRLAFVVGAPFLLLFRSGRARFSFGRPAAPLDGGAAVAVLVRCMVFLMMQQLGLLFKSPATFTTAVGFAGVVGVISVRARRVLGHAVAAEKCRAPERLVAFFTHELALGTHLSPVCGQLGTREDKLSN